MDVVGAEYCPKNRLLTLQINYDCMGLCLSRNGDYSEAVKWYLKLRKYSKRIGHLWGIGQSYINCGSSYFQNNDKKKAERCYRKAIEHGITTDDKWLLGRSLHNLAMAIFDRDVVEATKIMDESLIIKESVGDREGVAGALLGYGRLAIQRGDFKEALQWFQRAEKKAKK